MKIWRFLGVIIVATGMVLLMPMGVGAADDLNPICKDLPEAAGCGDTGAKLEESFPRVVDALFGIAGVLAVGMIVYAGVKIAMSQGDATRVAQERKTITYSVIGLIIVIASYGIVRLIVEVF